MQPQANQIKGWQEPLRTPAQQSLAGLVQACDSMVRLRTSCHPSGPFASPGGEPRRMTGRRSLPKPESKQVKASNDEEARDRNEQNRKPEETETARRRGTRRLTCPGDDLLYSRYVSRPANDERFERPATSTNASHKASPDTSPEVIFDEANSTHHVLRTT